MESHPARPSPSVPKRPTARIRLQWTTMEMGALKALNEMDIRCPKDLSLAVFDELPGSGSFSPEVTMVVQPANEIGYKGAKLLIEQIESGRPVAPIEVRLSSELRIRESTLTRCKGSSQG